ncbi:hypothetical protein [Helicobacter sp.]|uniref:hypothetical protein n=1 Tax=Helicobacter sp. TaxID=218 RepID=UPI0025C61CF4|nr:hypothetical protein [Helicobacter sp.]MCI5632868.1 hypothetical protein [Helicobacter sp.]
MLDYRLLRHSLCSFLAMTEGVDISSLREVVRFLSFLLRHCEIPPAESWQSINQRSYKWL